MCRERKNASGDKRNLPLRRDMDTTFAEFRLETPRNCDMTAGTISNHAYTWRHQQGIRSASIKSFIDLEHYSRPRECHVLDSLESRGTQHHLAT